LKTSAKRVGEVLSALVEGLDVSAAVRVFGHGEGTIRTWLTRAGLHSGQVHRHFFHDLSLKHLQLDELRTTLRQKSREVWLWVALDVETKVVLVLQLGPRTQAMAHRVVHELCRYLASGCIPLFTSDGLDHYFYALTAHFGQWSQAIRERKRHWEVSAQLESLA
jgi:transposase-like protein